MERIVTAKVGGTEILLNYSVGVMFAVNDKFGSTKAAVEKAEQNNLEGLEAVCWLAAEMAADAELCRRAAGYEPREMPATGEFSARMLPADFAALREAVICAIVYGLKRELPESDKAKEIDLGLMELEEKK